MAALGNRRSRVDTSRCCPGNRTPGALESPLALIAQANAQKVAEASADKAMAAQIEALDIDGINTTLANLDNRVSDLEAP